MRIHAGGRDWRAAELSPASLQALFPDLALIDDPEIPTFDKQFAFIRIAGALFLPLQPDLTAKLALEIFKSEHVAPVMDEVARQAAMMRVRLRRSLFRLVG